MFKKFFVMAGMLLLLPSCWYSTEKSTVQAPRVTHFEWGKTIISGNGTVKEYEDCHLWPTGSATWDWRKTGTHHRPGIQIADVEDLVDKADIFILSRGIDLVLQTQQETIDYLKGLGKEVYVLQSQEAVKKYHELVDEGKRVALLLHSTC